MLITGSDSVRPYWCKYLTGVEGIVSGACIYVLLLIVLLYCMKVVVVDSMDGDEELSTAFKEVYTILQEESLRSLPLMVLLHKQDLSPKLEEEVCVMFLLQDFCKNFKFVHAIIYS